MFINQEKACSTNTRMKLLSQEIRRKLLTQFGSN